MIQQHLLRVILPPLLSLLCGCSSVTFTSVATQAYHHQQLKSFAFAPQFQQRSRLVQRNPLFMDQLKRVATNELSNVGFIPSHTLSDADFLLVIDTTVTTMPGILTPEEIRYKRGTYGSSIPEANPRLRSLQERIFSLEVYERASSTLLWCGTVEHLLPEFYESEPALRQVLHELSRRLTDDLK